MKKLLVLALLGLGLGGVIWKMQNPEGTVDDLRSQATAVAERLSGGVEAGVQSIRTASNTSATTTDEGSEQLAEVSGLLDGAQTRIDAADQRLSAQDETIAATNASMAELDQKITAVSDSFTEFNASVKEASAANEADIVRLDAIDSRLELVVRRLDEQTTGNDLELISESINLVNTQLAMLEENYSGFEESVSSDLADINERTDRLNLRINTLATSDGSDVSDLTDQDSEESGDIAASTSVPAFNAGLDERFSAIEARLETVNSDSRLIATMTRQLEDARQKITQLEERDANTSQNVRRINGTLSELKTASESLSIDTVQAEVRDQLALAQSTFESNGGTSNTDALEELLNTTRSQIETLEKRVQELPASSTEADNAQQIQSALESQIAALERRLETSNNTDPELVSSLTNVQEQVDQLEAKGFVTQDDLRAQKESKAIEYKIYFDRNSTEVSEDAAKVLSSFIAQEKNRTTGVSIFGFTDRRGSAAYNQQLALQRATNVRSFLIQNGLDYTKIKALSGLGEDAAAAVLPDDADDAQQRVVVLYAAQK